MRRRRKLIKPARSALVRILINTDGSASIFARNLKPGLLEKNFPFPDFSGGLFFVQRALRPLRGLRAETAVKANFVILDASLQPRPSRAGSPFPTFESSAAPMASDHWLQLCSEAPVVAARRRHFGETAWPDGQQIRVAKAF